MTPTPPPAAPVPASADTDLMLVERAAELVEVARRVVHADAQADELVVEVA